MTQFTGVAEVVAQQLWTTSWQGTLAVLLALLVLRMLQRLPAAFHCWVWRFVCIKMLVAFFWLGSVELPLLTAEPKPLRGPAHEVAATPSSPATTVVPDKMAGVPLDLGSLQAVERRPKASPESNARTLIIASLWLAGVLWQTTIVFVDWRKSIRLIRQSTQIRDAVLVQVLSAAAHRLGTLTPKLRRSDTLKTPVAIGIAHPTVILPRRITATLNASQMRMLLMHELAHFQRRDLIWNWLGVVVGVLFFFHPFVWVMQQRWLHAQESACDDVVLGETPNSPAEYANMLLECSIPESYRSLGFVSGATTTANSLRKRIEQMKNKKSVSNRALVFATGCLAFTTVIGVVPWKLAPATAQAQDTQPTAEKTSQEPYVSVAKTFEIGPEESSLAHDGALPNDDRQLRRQQFRNARRVRMSGRLGQGGAGGGTRSNVAGRSRIQGPGSSGAGGFAGGTMERPNYVVALRLSPVEHPAVVTVVEGTIAIDTQGNEYEPLTQMGMSRMAVPDFEAAHPDCAGAYFRLSTQRRPKSFKEIRGKLRVTPITFHEATFPIANLTEGSTSETDFGRISIGRFHNDDGWKFEVTTPGPGVEIREVFRYAGMVYVELIDSKGETHRPRMQSGSGSRGGIGGAPGIDQITQIVAFDELDDGVKAEQLVVRIRELGEADLVSFSVKDVEVN